MPRRNRIRKKVRKFHSNIKPDKIAKKHKGIKEEDLKVKFSTESMDYEGKWGWQNFDNRELQELIPKIINFSDSNFSELGFQGSHFIIFDKLVKEAQDRLRELKEEDTEKLFSLRLAGKKRIWCIMKANVLQILWWDPKHEVCPSHKKHT